MSLSAIPSGDCLIGSVVSLLYVHNIEIVIKIAIEAALSKYEIEIIFFALFVYPRSGRSSLRENIFSLFSNLSK